MSWGMRVALTGLLLAAGVAQAEVRPQAAHSLERQIDTIHVYGRNGEALTSPGLEAARARLRERPGGTAVLDSEALRDRRQSTLSDALGFAPGVFVQPRFGAEEARLSIRGSGLQRSFHLRGVLLLQDGVPLNQADGGGDFQAVEMLSSRYIEVYRGASALEYGAATLGGAINFVSPTGHDAPPLSLRAEGGSFGYRRGQVAAATVGQRADGYLSLSGYRQDGYRNQSTQENYRLFANLGYRFRDDLEGRLYLARVDSRSQLPGALTRQQYTRDPSTANPRNVTDDWRRDVGLTRLAGRIAWRPAAGRQWTGSVYYLDTSMDHPIFQVLRVDSRDAGLDLRYRHDGRIGAHRNVVTLGLAWRRGDNEDRRFVNLAGRPGAPSARSDQRAENLEAFVENQFYLAPNLALIAGLQGLRAERELEDRFQAGGVDRGFERRYHSANPRLGLRYLPADGVELFANVSRSYEPPSFGELSGGPDVTPVDAQRALTAEVGARLERETLSVDVALYRAWLDKELLALTDARGTPLGTVNAGDTIHQGVELGLGWQPLPPLLVSASYLYHDFHFDDDPVFGDNRLAGAPPQQLRLELRWRLTGQLYLAPNLEWQPQRSYVDHANTVSAKGYSIYGLRIGGVLGELQWFVDGRNLGDRRYVATTSVIADAGGADGAYYLPGDGRSVFAGLEWGF